MKKKQELQQKLSVRANYRKFKWLYWMILPIIIYYAVFMYIPMFGQVIAFQDYRPARGIGGSEWVGLENFVDFFKSPFAWRVIRNTIIISVNEIIFGFPAPIILALLINEKIQESIADHLLYSAFHLSCCHVRHYNRLRQQPRRHNDNTDIFRA